MTERFERLLAEAIRTDRPVLIDPTEDEIRMAAERLRLEGRLSCTACRKPITDPEFVTQRVSFGPRLQAVVHLHTACAVQLAADAEPDDGQAGHYEADPAEAQVD